MSTATELMKQKLGSNAVPTDVGAAPKQSLAKKIGGFAGSVAKAIASPFARLGVEAYNTTSGVMKAAQGDIAGANAELDKPRNLPLLGETKPTLTNSSKPGLAQGLDVAGQGIQLGADALGGEGFGSGVMNGIKTGATIGATQGFGNALTETQGKSFGQNVGNVLTQTAVGGATGGVIGGATNAIHPIFQRSNPILDPNAVSPYDVGAATANREAASVNAVKGINEMNQAAQSDISQMGQEFRQGAVNLEKKLSSNDNPLLQEAKKYKSAEEFVKAQGKPAFHGSDKASLIEKQGFKIMPSESARGYGDGIYFTETKANAKGYGDVVHSYIPKDLNLYKATEADTYKIDTKKLMAEGYDGVKLPGTGGFTIFDTSKIKTKSQLTDIWNKASKSQLSPTVNLTKGQLEQLNNIRETKNFALPDFANTEGTQATLGGKPINLGAMNPKVAAQIGASQGEIGASLTPTQMQDLMTQVNRATIQAKSTGEFAVNQQLIGLRNELKTASSKAFGPEWDKIYSNFAQGHSVMEKLDGIVNLDPKATPVELNKQLATIQKLGETPEGQKFLQQAIEEYKNVRGIDLTDPVAAANSVLKAQGQLEIAQEGSYGTRLVRALKNPNLAARRIALVATALLGLTAGATAFRKQIASFFTGQ